MVFITPTTAVEAIELDLSMCVSVVSQLNRVVYGPKTWYVCV